MKVYINGKQSDYLERKRVSVHDLIKHLNVSRPQAELTIEVNGEEVNHAQWMQHGVKEEDEVHIHFDA